ncbi:hypothetical protein Bca52824_018612 [Brassica carinata]|uniref:Uncharacterized protein n=1 Tax=Brassica carinata TaxID=52824 RepID=A0A8X8AXM9_BRACI|nr:hypothetical protein Bca52824_018612 [Brassica carinata]
MAAMFDRSVPSSKSTSTEPDFVLHITFDCWCQEGQRLVSYLQGILRRQVDIEYKALKTKLQDMLNIEKQIIQTGGKVPQVDIN